MLVEGTMDLVVMVVGGEPSDSGMMIGSSRALNIHTKYVNPMKTRSIQTYILN